MFQKTPLPPCPLCGGKRKRAKLKAPGFGNEILVVLHDEDLPKGRASFRVEAWFCTACGHIELQGRIDRESECL